MNGNGVWRNEIIIMREYSKKPQLTKKKNGKSWTSFLSWLLHHIKLAYNTNF